MHPLLTDPSRAFDAAFRRRAPTLDLYAEAEGDRAFLVALFAACSPLARLLPPPLMAMQAEAQIASHRRTHPLAMGRVVRFEAAPIGRFLVDWDCHGACHGVDIAVLPDARRSGAALAMLRAWIEVADRLGRPCSLEVLRDNPAARLYARLGFVACGADDGSQPVIAMQRAAAPRS